MRNLKTEAIIIRRRNIGEADRILTVFTKEYGKMQIKASGVRKIVSRRSGHVELLNHSLLTLYKGPVSLILTEAQTFDNFSYIKNDLQKIGFAYHICELIDSLCPEGQENRAVFELLKSTMQRLSVDKEAVSIINEFEVDLLNNLGYWNTAHDPSVVDTKHLIEEIIEKKLKSTKIFAKIN